MLTIATILGGGGYSAVAAPLYKATLTASGYTDATTLANFPVLVRVSPETIDGFSYGDCATDGSDISFVDADGNVIQHEIDTWNTSGESLVWVRIPSLAANTTFTMRWKDAAPASSASLYETWNSDYIGVWHMGEASGVCRNSSQTGSDYDATPMSNTVNSVRYTGTDAPVGGARTTATSVSEKGYLSVPSFEANGVFTISGWVRIEGIGQYGRFLSRRSEADKTGFEIESQNFSDTKFSARGNANNATVSVEFPTALTKTWTHFSFVYDGSTLTVYGNGAQIATGTIWSAADNGLPLAFGCSADGSASGIAGQFDECRLMKGAASAAWVKAEYDTVKSEDFLSYGRAQPVDADSVSVGSLNIVETGDNYVKVKANVLGLGKDASSATVTVAYGLSADAMTQKVEASVDSATSCMLTLTRLLPGYSYAMRVTVKNDQGASASGDVQTFTTAVSSDVNGLPGLYQTVFTSANAAWTKDYTTVAEGTDWTNYSDSNRIYRRELGAIAAYATKNQTYASEIWGDQVYWKENGLQWCYWGYMWLNAGASYKFRAKIDDSTYLAVTDSATAEKTVLINDTTWSTADVSATYTPSATGWYPVEIRLSDASGGAGACDSTDSYKNTVNLGYSSDGGSTWNLMLDSGDGALFRAKLGSTISVAENVANGKLTLDLSFAATESDRTLAVVWGGTHGGETTNGWAHAEIVGTVAANETTHSYEMPETWGNDDCLVVRFCFVSDDAAPQWSNSTYWRDLVAPVFGDLTLDGTGGDTLVVKGSLASFGGDSCTLKVMTGTSATSLTQVWSDLDGSTLSKAGDFSLTLFADKDSANYLKPGSTVYVCIEATDADGKMARSETMSVEMSSVAKFAADPSIAVDHRTVTVTGSLTDLGCGTVTAIELYVGDSDDEASLVKSDATVTLTDSSYSVTHTFDEFEKDYRCQIRVVSTAKGETASVEAKSTVVKCHTVDTATYTWKGGESDTWESKDNWTDNAGGVCLGYPKGEKSKAVFPANTTAKIALREPHTIGGLDLTAANANVTFTQGGSGTNATKLTINNASGDMKLSGANSSLTLDNVAFAANNIDVYVGATFTLAITNGSDYCGTKCIFNTNGGTLLLSGNSTLGLGDHHVGPGTVIIDDSKLTVRNVKVYSTGVFRFLGASPLLLNTGVNGYFRLGDANTDARLEFSVPAEGYASAPLQGTVGAFGSGGTSGKMTAAVLSNSPARWAEKEFTTTLISWPNGINTNILSAVSLPKKKNSYAWGEEASAGNPKTLSVTLGGTSGMMLIIR